MSDNAYISQAVTEVLYKGQANAKISQALVETLYNSNANAKISQVIVEVLRPIDAINEFDVSITSSGNLDQTYHVNYIKFFNIINTADIDQTISHLKNFEIHFTNTANISQNIFTNIEKSIFVVTTGNINQNIFVNSPRVISVSNQLFVSHTINGVNATFIVNVVSTGNLNQFNTARQGLYRVNVVSSANISGKFIRRDLIFNISIVSAANIHQRITSEYRLQLVTTGNLNQTIGKLRITSQIFADMNTLINTFQPTRESLHHLSDPLTITSTFAHTGEYERDFSDVQILTDTFRQAIIVSDSGYVYDPYPVGPGQPPRVIPPHPVATGTPVISAKQTVINSPGGNVILPAAEFGETFGAKVQNTVKKTMTGKIYTYIKTQPFDVFTLTWVLGLQKSLELASVIKNNNDNFLGPYDFYTLTLWNGQIWRAKVISSDIPVTHEGRWQNSDNNESEIEKMSVTVQFEGTQLL